MLKNFKILITGATGLIGSHLVARLIEDRTNQVTVMGRNRTRMEQVFSDYLENPCFKIVEHNVALSFPDLGSFDYIFHAAGPIASITVREKPVNVIFPNIEGTINCLEYLKKNCYHKSKMIIFSSATVYGNLSDSDITVDENDTIIADSLNSIASSYSESKRMVEVIANAYHKQYGLNVLIARFGYIYGPTIQIPKTAFYSFVKDVIAGNDVTINNISASRRDNIYVNDAVDGLLLMCKNGISGEAYNISSGGDMDNFAAIDEIAQHICSAANILIKGNNSKVLYCESLQCRKPGIILGNNKLKKLGWEIKTPLGKGIYETIKAFI